MQEASALVSVLVIIAFVGGLSLLAHWGRKNRGAEISLFVIVLFLSFLVVGVGASVYFVGRSDAILDANLPPELFLGAALVLVLAGVAGIALCVPPLRRIIARSRAAADAGTLPTSGDTAARPVFWSDPVIFFALWMFVVVLAQNLVSLLAFTYAPDAVGAVLTSGGRASVPLIIIYQLPLLAIGVLGVGFGIRRDLRETLARLGYGRITARQLGIVAIFVGVALTLEFVADALFRTLQPGLYERVGEITGTTQSPIGLSLASALLFATVIELGAAAGEETLFRGAVQPALGIVAASVLWASLHVQYGPSIVVAYIFVLSLALGILRNRINTTATFIAHAAYNFISVMLAYFLGA